MNKKLRIFLSISMLLSLSFFFVGCSNSSKNMSTSELKSLPENHLEGTFGIDMYNPEETVGDADYVFLARVDQQVNTEYRHSVMIETENGQKEVSTPYTNYKITVVKNIKGNIKKDKSIPITKAGGVDKDNSSVILFEDDNLPETNKLYVFLAYAQEDGSLLVSGPNSNILVGNSNKSEISTNLPLDEKASKVISSYEKAKTNQVVRERIHFTSNFDENK